MDYFRESEYYQMVSRKECEWDRIQYENLVEETEEEFAARVARKEK